MLSFLPNQVKFVEKENNKCLHNFPFNSAGTSGILVDLNEILSPSNCFDVFTEHKCS